MGKGSRLYMLLLMKHLISPEELEKTLRIYRGTKTKMIEKYLIVKVFAETCLEETTSDVITPKSNVFNCFQYFRRVNGLMQDFPIIKINGLTSLLCQFIKFSETRTWRGGRQTRAFKGIKIKQKGDG